MMNESFIGSEIDSKSVDSNESADSLSEEDFEKLGKEQENRIIEQKRHEKIEAQEHLTADLELEDNLSELSSLELIKKEYPNNEAALSIGKAYIEENTLLGITPTTEELKDYVSEKLEKKENLSTAEQIKNYKEELSAQGKPPKEILQILIAKFDNEPAVKTWVENWKNYLKLHQYAESKPPKERHAIQNIIAKADFTSENSFENSLTEISNSTELSAQTKLEISQRFSGKNITSVDEMDTVLNQIKSRKSKIEQAIEGKSQEKISLESEITELEKELEALPPDDPKAEELQKKLAEKKMALQQTETGIESLEKEKPEEISYTLRNGVAAKLNSNGSRTINIEGSNFAIQLPDNTLFMGRKNMLSINLAFTYKALSNVGMESLFTPKLNSGEVPDKKQRLFSNHVLQQLGYKTGSILSQTSINQLEKDLSKLKQKGSNSTGKEDLTALGIWDASAQEVNIVHLKSSLNFVRANRNRQIEFEDIRGYLANNKL